MSVVDQERGFAIALLLWMIAGMSLTVAAVIHFARADIGMAELRVREAKALAIGRGVAHLLLRDSAMIQYQPVESESQATRQSAGSEEDGLSPKGFSKTYEFANGWRVTGSLRPSSGFVSLNDGTREELIMVFSGLGKIDEGVATEIADAALRYRQDFSGFRYTEELLSIPGPSRIAYDGVKTYVHPYHSGSIAPSEAPEALRALSESSDLEGEAISRRPEGNKQRERRRSVLGKVTFDAIEAAMRNPGGSAAKSISAVELVLSQPGGPSVSHRIWVDSESPDPVIRVGPVVTTTSANSR